MEQKIYDLNEYSLEVKDGKAILDDDVCPLGLPKKVA